MNLPNVWPDGGLFVFSGMDGETSWRWPFHAVPTVNEVGLDLYVANKQNHVSRIAKLALPRRHGPSALEGAIVLSDAAHLPASADQPEVVLAWQDRRTLVGWVSGGAPTLAAADGSPASGREAGVVEMVAPGGGAIVLMSGADGRFALAYDEASADAAVARARAGVMASPRDVLEERARYQSSVALPANLGGAEERLARKCAAVLKANTETPQGAIPRRWTTPDRLPHRNMWLWDSAFHAIALVYIDQELAKDAILAPLSRLRPDGMLPHMVAPDPAMDSAITQPPLLAWAAWKVYEATRDRAFLEEAYAPAARYLSWDLEHRKHGELLGWQLDDDPLCRCGESGLDNSPRFDKGDISAAVDFSSEAALEAESLGRIAAELGRSEDAASWRGVRDRLARAVETHLWDESRSIYRDLAADPVHGFNPVETHISFLPLIAGIPIIGRAKRLVRTLCDPRRFWRAMPVPSTAADDRNYSDDMWRGPTWVNINYLIIEGLRRYGFGQEAHELAQRTLAGVLRGYQAEGVLFEFFDAEGTRPSGELSRKGGPGRREASALGVIRDYGWTAAVTLRLLLEGEEVEQRQTGAAGP